MDIFQLLATVGIPSFVALVGLLKVTTEMRVKRHVEITNQFLDLVAVAHARPRDGRGHAGISEQVAATELVAAFARRDRLFAYAANAFLSSIEGWAGGEGNLDTLRSAAQQARSRLPRRYRKG